MLQANMPRMTVRTHHPADAAVTSHGKALRPGVRKREAWAWAMYDFANSGYTTVVLTAVFAAYFVGAVAGGAVWATFAWTLALSVSHAIVMVTMPAMGAWADRFGAKKRLLLFTTLGCVLATAALAFVGPGMVALAVLLIIVSNVCFAWGESLIAAFLPELARPAAMGRVSGWGWSFGYFGGMLALGLSLVYVIRAQGQGQTAAQFVPVTMWITAGIFALAALVTFKLLKERAKPQARSAEGGLKASLSRLHATYRNARRYRDAMTAARARAAPSATSRRWQAMPARQSQPPCPAEVGGAFGAASAGGSAMTSSAVRGSRGVGCNMARMLGLGVPSVKLNSMKPQFIKTDA